MNTPLPEGKMLFEGEVVDAFENCDVDYACTFPPCVAEREAEAEKYAASFRRAVRGGLDDDAYEPGDPKRSDYLERVGA